MFDNEMLDLDLQLFAEDTDDQPAGDDQQEEKMVTVSEMLRRLDKSENDWKDKYDSLQQSIDERIAKAVKEAEKEAEMTGEELREHREEQAEKEKQDLLAQIEELKQKEQVRELRDEARKTLESHKINASDDVVDLVIRGDQEQTLAAIKALDGLLAKQREELASFDAPITGGGSGSGSSQESMFDILDKGKTTGF